MAKILNRWDGNIIAEDENLNLIDLCVKYKKNLQNADLREADLHGADLHRANLRGADLHGANLRVADLHGADLRRADLHEADLHGANLRVADLHGADLRVADLHGANLYEADLHGANLHGANLHGANLLGANLHRANLDFSCLPLWCGGLNWKSDEKQRVQIVYHLFNLIKNADNATEEEKKFYNENLPYANKMHRSDVPRLEKME